VTALDGSEAALGEGPAGQRFGDFDLLEPIGEGATAVVYRAVSRTLTTEVALKRWRATATASQRRKFLQECRLQWRLSDHPNIVRLYWAGAPEDGPPWLATELYECSLADRLEDGDPELADALRLGDHILAGLSAVHDAGMVHRDVKPGNVLLKGDHAALADLGISMHLHAWTEDSAAGSAAYLAPEVHRGEAPTFRSDVYSAAVTLRRLVGGDPPAPLERLLTRAASHAPGDRPADATEFRAALAEVSARLSEKTDGPSQAPRSEPAPTSGAARGVVGRRRVIRFAVPVLAVAVVLAALSWLTPRRPGPSPPAAQTRTSRTTVSTVTQAGSVPAGWHLATATAGLMVASPNQWTVRPVADTQELRASDPAGSGIWLQFGGYGRAHASQLARVRSYEKAGGRTGYRRLALSATSFPGSPDAVRWEYVYRSGGLRHAAGLYWRNGNREYVIYANGPAERWAQTARVFDQAVATAAVK
jgi:hypothetical protein